MGSIIKPYEWREDELSPLTDRGWIKLPGCYDPYGYVCGVKDPEHDTLYMVKLVRAGSRDVEIIRYLSVEDVDENHTIPAEVIQCKNSDSFLIIMPYLFSDLITWRRHNVQTLFSFITQLIEGLEFMHDRHIVHFDLYFTNLVYSRVTGRIGDWSIPAWRLYFIDFGSSRHLPSGPGSGIVVQDYQEAGGHFEPPEGTKDLDPYAYDVYSLGITIYHFHRFATEHFPVPVSVQEFADALAHDIPSERPSIREAKKRWSALLTSIQASGSPAPSQKSA